MAGHSQERTGTVDFPIQTHPRFALGLDRGDKAPECPTCIPWAMMQPHERQAMRNHGQSLADLASRAGLSPAEAIAVLEDREWRHMSAEESCKRLCEMVRDFAAKPKEEPDHTPMGYAL